MPTTLKTVAETVGRARTVVNEYLLTPAAARFARIAVTVTIGIPLAVAPLLGTKKVPGLLPLLGAIPPELRDELVRFSIIIVTLVAIGFEFYFGQKIRDRSLSWVFPRALAAAGFFVAALYLLQATLVLRVPYNGGRSTALVLTTWTRLPECGCDGLNDIGCVRNISLDPEALQSCWGGRQRVAVHLLIALSYFGIIALTVSCIGLVMLRFFGGQRAGRRRRRRRGSPPSPA